MKKTICMTLALCLLLSLFACGTATTDQPDADASPASDVSQPVESDTTEPANSEGGGIEVEQGLFNVTITLPAEYAEEGWTQEDYDQAAQEAGWQSATLNEDGSVTYVMTKAQHDAMMTELADSIDSALEKMVGSEDYPNFVSIVANDDYTDFVITTKSEELDFNETFSTLAFYIYGGMYHAFNGTTPENIHIAFVNDVSGEVIDELNSSDMGE